MSQTKYMPFKGLYWRAKARYLKAGIVKKNIDLLDLFKQEFSAARAHYASSSLTIEQKIEFCNALIQATILEHMYYSLSHTVLYVAANLCKALARTKSDTICLDRLSLPSSLFEICWETGRADFDGSSIGSLFCAIRPDNKIITDSYKAVTAGMNGTYVGHNLVGLSCASSDGWGYHPFTASDALVDGRSCKEIVAQLPIRTFGVPDFDVPNPQEKMRTKVSELKALFAVLSWLNTEKPDVLSYRDFDRPVMGLSPSISILGSTFKHMPPSWHLRRGHFRHLEHERFKRDESGKAKVIWVRETEVGKDREPAYPKAKVLVQEEQSVGGKEEACASEQDRS